jgi:hypothetical protein
VLGSQFVHVAKHGYLGVHVDFLRRLGALQEQTR